MASLTKKNRKPNGSGSINSDGYKLIYVDGKRKYEHIHVVEQALGKKLPKGAVIHHIDENKLNNSKDNLVVCPDQSYHMLIERRSKAFAACGNADWLRCKFCKKYDKPENIYWNKKSGCGYHKECVAEYLREKNGFGERHRNFTLEEVNEIRLLLSNGSKVSDIAKRFNVNVTTIYRIKRGVSSKFHSSDYTTFSSVKQE